MFGFWASDSVDMKSIPIVLLIILGFGIIGWITVEYSSVLYSNQGLGFLPEVLFFIQLGIGLLFVIIGYRSWKREAPALPAAILATYFVYFLSFRIQRIVSIRNTQLAVALLILAMTGAAGLTMFFIRRKIALEGGR